MCQKDKEGTNEHSIPEKLLKNMISLHICMLRDIRKRGRGKQAPIFPFTFGSRGSKSSLFEMQLNPLQTLISCNSDPVNYKQHINRR